MTKTTVKRDAIPASRWLARLATTLLIVAGVSLTATPPAVADYTPVVTVTGSTECSDFDGDTHITWSVHVTIAPEGYYYGGEATFEVSPAIGFYGSGPAFSGPISLLQVIPHGSGVTTATLTVTVNYVLPGGNLVVADTGSVNLPFCPKPVQASATFEMNCDRSVNVTIIYPLTAEKDTSVTVYGWSLSGATWNSGPLTVRAGGQVLTVVVPSPFTTSLSVTQVDALASQTDAFIGQSGTLPQPTACPIQVPSAGQPPANQPGNPTPPAQGSGGTGGSSGVADGSTTPVSESPGPLPTGSPTRTRPAGSPDNATPVAAGAETSKPMSLVLVAVLGLVAGLGTMLVIAAGVIAFLVVRQRRRRPDPVA